MIDLLPCPFCGGSAARLDIEAVDGEPNAGGSCIECTRCGACSPVHFDRKENLASSWNDRTGASLLLEDANDLDAVVHELGIADSHITPAEAVRELKRENEILARAATEAHEAGCRDAGLWNSSGLQLLYDIRASLWLNDKFPLSMLPSECRRISERVYDVGFRDAISLAAGIVRQAAAASVKIKTPTAETISKWMDELECDILLLRPPARNGE